MIAPLALMENSRLCFSNPIPKVQKILSKRNPQSGNRFIPSSTTIFSNRRPIILCSGALILSIFYQSPIKAEELTLPSQENEEGNGVLGSIKTFFDPDEKTKSGKILPKAYLKSAREVVKTLRESLDEDSKDVGKFRRTADAAKESIREYLSRWRGQQEVKTEESYAAIEKAIRSLASFYSKAGPFATLSEEARTSILNDLNVAEANL